MLPRPRSSLEILASASKKGRTAAPSGLGILSFELPSASGSGVSGRGLAEGRESFVSAGSSQHHSGVSTQPPTAFSFSLGPSYVHTSGQQDRDEATRGGRSRSRSRVVAETMLACFVFVRVPYNNKSRFYQV